MLAYPWLAIVVTGVALFFVSFLSWMVLQLHARDWRKLGPEDDFLKAVRELAIPSGNYMFPGCETPADMKTPEFAQKREAGPVGVLSVFPSPNMGKQLALTLLHFLVISFCLAYLTRLAFDDPGGVGFGRLFRFVATAALLSYLASFVQHAIWFHNRIVGHIVESVAYAVITGLLFAALWPSGAASPDAPNADRQQAKPAAVAASGAPATNLLADSQQAWEATPQVGVWQDVASD